MSLLRFLTIRSGKPLTGDCQTKISEMNNVRLQSFGFILLFFDIQMSIEMVESRAPCASKTITCPHCNISIEFSIPPTLQYAVACYACSGTIPQTSPKPKKAAGTDASPVDLQYYELLGVEASATNAQIKKAYYLGALKYHPDKNTDPEAESKFKRISEAYQVLSDTEKRAFYNRNGLNVQSENGFSNAESFFKQQFGGDSFVDIIGELVVAKHVSDILRGGDSVPKDDPKLRVEQRAQRVHHLAEKLRAKLCLFSDAFPLFENVEDVDPIGTTIDHISQEAMSSFRVFAELEANALKTESYGVELLHSIGYTYILKADQWVAAIDHDKAASLFSRAWGIGARFTGGMKEQFHVIGETGGTIKAAFELQSSFTKLSNMEKIRKETGASITAEEEELKRKLEAEAQTKGIWCLMKGLEALWRGSKMEVEGVLRNVCDEVLGNASVKAETRRRRALAMRVLGEVYQSVTHTI